MSKNKRISGLILARGGSKGIPNKNIKLLNGRPLLDYALKEALKSKYLNGIWVSSDSDEILTVAFMNGARTIERPKELSDGSKPIEAIQHFIKEEECDIIVLLNACCPLTTVKDIDNAIGIMLKTGCDSVVSLVGDFSSSPTKLCYLEDGKVIPLGTDFKTEERQKLPPIYKRNTAFYLIRRATVEKGLLFGSDTRGYIMPKERSWDINDMMDWKIAEFLIKERDGNTT